MLRNVGRHAEAAAVFGEATLLLRQTQPPTHHDIIAMLINHARVYLVEEPPERLAEAERLLEEAIRLRRDAHEEDQASRATHAAAMRRALLPAPSSYRNDDHATRICAGGRYHGGCDAVEGGVPCQAGRGRANFPANRHTSSLYDPGQPGGAYSSQPPLLQIEKGISMLKAALATQRTLLDEDQLQSGVQAEASRVTHLEARLEELGDLGPLEK